MEEIKEDQRTLVPGETSKMQSEPCIDKETIQLKKDQALSVDKTQLEVSVDEYFRKVESQMPLYTDNTPQS